MSAAAEEEGPPPLPPPPLLPPPPETTTPSVADEGEDEGGQGGASQLDYTPRAERDVLCSSDDEDDDEEEEEYEEEQGHKEGLQGAGASASASASAGAGAGPQPLQGEEGKEQATAHYYTFLSSKAGMESVSKEEVVRVVHEASKNSRYYQHQQRQDQKMQARLDAIQAKCQALSAGQRRLLEERADRELAEAERAHRCLDRVCCVVDLDAFFAAVEERDRPELKTKPFAVGGGVICTASYVARRFGVRSAMPTFIARRLCPQLLVVPTRFAVYQEVAEQTRAVFREYDPHFRAGSLDEAYLDLTACVKARAAAAGVRVPGASGGGAGAGPGAGDGDEEEEEEDGEEEPPETCDAYWELAEAVVAEIRGRIQATCRITASAGIATSFMVAKIASNEKKPDGQFLARDVGAYLRPLPVRSVSGIGRKTERILTAGLGIHTVQDLYDKRALLYHAFTPLTAHWLATRYLGVDLGSGGGEADEEAGGGGSGGGGGDGYKRKGISRERTFETLSRRADIERKLRELCDGLAADMREEGLQARCVTLKLKDKDFNVVTRATTLGHYIAGADELFAVAHAALLPQLPLALRLMGVRASAFRPKPARDQGTLDAFLAKAKAEAQSTGPGPGGALPSPSPVPRVPSPPKRKESGSSGGGGPMDAFLVKRHGHGGSDGGNGHGKAERSGHHRDHDDDDGGVIVLIDDTPPSPPPASSGPSHHPSKALSCPVCGSVRAGESLAAFNAHVDGCLERTDPRFAGRKRGQEQQAQHEGGKWKKPAGAAAAAGPLDAFMKHGGK